MKWLVDLMFLVGLRWRSERYAKMMDVDRTRTQVLRHRTPVEAESGHGRKPATCLGSTADISQAERRE